MTFDTDAVEYGDPCKRCSTPMTPRHFPRVEGMREHVIAGYCDACRKALARPMIRRAPLLETVDDIVDEVAVDRAANNDHQVRATAAELGAAVHRLARMGRHPLDIAHALGMPLAFVDAALASNDPAEDAAA